MGVVSLTAEEVVGANVLPAGTVVTTIDDRRAADLAAAGAATRLDATPDGWNLDDIENGDKVGGELIALTASTPVTLNLASIGSRDGWGGDKVFAKVTGIVLVNQGTTNVIIGNAASTPFNGPLGSSGATDKPTYTLRPGDALAFRRDDTTGYTTTSANNLKIDPGGSAGTLSIAVKGFSS